MTAARTASASRRTTAESCAASSVPKLQISGTWRRGITSVAQHRRIGREEGDDVLIAIDLSHVRILTLDDFAERALRRLHYARALAWSTQLGKLAAR